MRLGLSSEPLRDSARALLLAGLGFAGVLVLLGVGITVLLTRRIVEPINQLVEASRNVAEGDLDHPVIVSSHGEIGELAQAFNHMVDNLRATQRKVEAHSGALQETVEQLLAATEEAQAFAEGATVASKAKSAFLASMSHELRTPLNAIIGYTEMLVEEAEEEGFEVFTHDLARVHTAAEQLLSLINEVLDLSKIEAGLMTVELESVDLRPVLDEIGVVVHPMAETNRVEVAIHYDASLVRMQTNAQRLRQILLNLVTNAVKFTSRGKVEVSVRQVSDEGEWLEIAVVDTGMGMTEEQLSRVFEPFVQGDDSTARNYGGTGLGLTISRHFAELMGGSLQAVSTYGEGSTFTLRLPLSTDSAPHTLRPGLLTSDDLRGAA